VFLKNRGMKIALGGIAKGYAIKRAADVLIEQGISSAIVDEGGDLQVIGKKFRKRWISGLVEPWKNDVLLSIKMNPGESIATSGNYARRAIYHHKIFHHIINPKTGKPTKTFSSVSVITKNPVEADAYATSIFVMGLKKTLQFLKHKKNLSVILIDLKNKIYISKSLKKRIVLFKKLNVVWF